MNTNNERVVARAAVMLPSEVNFAALVSRLISI